MVSIFGPMTTKGPAVPRHKTAISRATLSRPVRTALKDGLIDATVTVFDYGCGHGRDAELLTEQGIITQEWDPAFFPAQPRLAADAVNLGYVINVIESPGERAEVLRNAWDLSRRVLIVSAQVLVPGRGQSRVYFGDGVLTSRGTFQKFFQQLELKTYIE
jgi:DNA phosphorothioation-associated putative methyltransferase